MEKRELGRSGIEVSRVILGCGNFGGVGSAPAFFGQGESDREAFAIMDAAWDLGITAFDTADAYGGGRSELAIGRWVRTKSSEVRDKLVLTTKTFNPMAEGADRGLSRSRILRQIDTSLERLGLERVPLYMAHAWDPDTRLEETVLALDELVRDGKVGAVERRTSPGGSSPGRLRSPASRGSYASSGRRTPTRCSIVTPKRASFPSAGSTASASPLSDLYAEAGLPASTSAGANRQWDRAWRPGPSRTSISSRTASSTGSRRSPWRRGNAASRRPRSRSRGCCRIPT